MRFLAILLLFTFNPSHARATSLPAENIFSLYFNSLIQGFPDFAERDVKLKTLLDHSLGDIFNSLIIENVQDVEETPVYRNAAKLKKEYGVVIKRTQSFKNLANNDYPQKIKNWMVTAVDRELRILIESGHPGLTKVLKENGFSLAKFDKALTKRLLANQNPYMAEEVLRNIRIANLIRSKTVTPLWYKNMRLYFTAEGERDALTRLAYLTEDERSKVLKMFYENSDDLFRVTFARHVLKLEAKSMEELLKTSKTLMNDPELFAQISKDLFSREHLLELSQKMKGKGFDNQMTLFFAEMPGPSVCERLISN